MSASAVCPECGEDIPLAGERFIQHGACPGWFVHVKLIDQVEDKLESRFTPPTELCPHPERWHSDDADSTEIEVSYLVGAFAAALRPDWVLETGTAWGQTAEAVAKQLSHGHLFTLEPDAERAQRSRDRCEGLPVTVIESKSLDWTVPEGVRFGFCWFDSLVDLRVPEFLKFREFMTDHAIVGFHDTAPHQGPLGDMILGLEAEGLLLPMSLPTPRGCTFAEVT